MLIEGATNSDRAAVIGEIAHIVPSSPTEIDNPRYDPDYPRELVDTYDNLLLLCPTHHTVVDKKPNTYNSNDLREWKQNIEDWVETELRLAMPGIGFAELELLTEGILELPDSGYSLEMPLDPTEKMKRNKLTAKVSFELKLGLSKAKEVADFVARYAALNPDFPLKLKAGFAREYRRLKGMGVIGDALFEGLLIFSSCGRSAFKYRAAGLAVIAYLFEACEVFER
jgi:hypothetical protein